MDLIHHAQKVASFLLNTKAVKLSPNNPFTWASGLKSPIYCDNRVLLSHPEARTEVKKLLAHLIRDHYPSCNAIVGVATAGIAPGALVADELNLPFGYVRSEAKKHGMGKQIEGDIAKDANIVIIEDLVSTGKSSLQAVNTVRTDGFQVLGLASIFTYGFQLAHDNFIKENCILHSLSNYNILIDEALKQGYVQADQIAHLSEWRLSPESWGV